MIGRALRAPDVRWFRSLWWANTRVCLWWAILPSGALHIERELVKDQCLISEFARDMRLCTKDLGIEETQDERYERLPFIAYTVALEAQMRGKASKGDDGETRGDTFRHNGILIRESSHDESQGWTRVAELLGTLPDGRPMLTIAPGCVQLVRALTNAVSDPNDPEVLLESAHDQPLRALRIGAMSRPAPRSFDRPELPKNAIGRLMEEIRNESEPSSGGIAWR